MRLFILFFISACCSACSFQQFLAKSTKPAGNSVVSRITLPNTGVEISIANWYKFRPRPGTPHLLMPHAIVKPTREQQLRAEDALLEWAIDHQPDSKN
ncbi:MAG: hypothetical protein GVY26_21875 [Bacteroidetes bacterium]|jgi:hypothetical protein|nr:hypothetical protein [Bacteroidota bacterium]